MIPTGTQAAPVQAGDPVTVIPKTSSQQQRSAWYTIIAGVGMALSALGEAFVQFEPQLAAAYPKVAWIPKAATAIGILMLASQRFGSAPTATHVNLSMPGAESSENPS